MPSLHHGAIFLGVFLIATGGSTAFLTSSQVGTIKRYNVQSIIITVMIMVNNEIMLFIIITEPPAGVLSVLCGAGSRYADPGASLGHE